jgi:4-hydroxybenzoate polyprenyltransferase/geranylgeranylglycerol-phosphate geranylgeranyltransferase
MRPYTVLWCGLVSLVGACVTRGTLPALPTALLIVFIPMMGWIAGLYLSDYLDRDLDLIQKPHRPIPSKRIQPREAILVGALFAFTGFFLTFLLTLYNVILVFIVASLVFLYTYISKSHGLSGNVNRGLVTVAAYFFGVFAINTQLSSLPLYVWLLSIVFLFHDTNSNLVGAIRDVEGDRKGGYRTIPVAYGIPFSVYLSVVLTALWLPLSLFLPFYYQFLSVEFYLLMALDIVILLVLYLYLFRSVHSYSREKGLRFHEFFVIERITLASAFIFGIAPLPTAILIYLIALGITGGSQYFLRKRYEFRVNHL